MKTGGCYLHAMSMVRVTYAFALEFVENYKEHYTHHCVINLSKQMMSGARVHWCM